jgi:hypothetical protein
MFAANIEEPHFYTKYSRKNLVFFPFFQTTVFLVCRYETDQAIAAYSSYARLYVCSKQV